MADPHTYYTTGQIPLADPGSGSSVWSVLWGELISGSHSSTNVKLHEIQMGVMGWGQAPLGFYMSYFRNIQVYDSTGIYQHGTGDGSNPRCLSPDTEIAMASGEFRMLRDVHPGDFVRSVFIGGFPEREIEQLRWTTGDLEQLPCEMEVRDVHYVYSSMQYVINGSIIATPSHLFLVRNLLNDAYGFKFADELSAEYFALVGPTGELTPIETIQQQEIEMEAMSLTVDTDVFLIKSNDALSIVHC